MELSWRLLDELDCELTLKVRTCTLSELFSMFSLNIEEASTPNADGIVISLPPMANVNGDMLTLMIIPAIIGIIKSTAKPFLDMKVFVSTHSLSGYTIFKVSRYSIFKITFTS